MEVVINTNILILVVSILMLVISMVRKDLGIFFDYLISLVGLFVAVFILKRVLGDVDSLTIPLTLAFCVILTFWKHIKRKSNKKQ